MAAERVPGRAADDERKSKQKDTLKRAKQMRADLREKAKHLPNGI